MHIARALRFAGYPLVFAVGEPLWTRPFSFSDGHHLVGSALFPEWAAAYVVFVVTFHLGASTPESARVRRLCMLGVMMCATLTMTALLDCDFGALSLVVLASQAALVLPWRHTAVLVAVQTAWLGLLVVKRLDWSDTALSHVVFLVAAEIFAAVSGHLARHATETARDLAHANAELRATRSLLEETSRAHERTRISRELHDVLGHDLAALGLQLEVATHVPPERAGAHVAKAKEVSARLLRNVREVVRATREAPGADLGRALRALCDGVHGMAVHLDMPADLQLEDAARGHCLLRCVQEIVTNAVKHSHAVNLWISMGIADGAITIEARDDGQGAREVRAGYGLSGMRARLEEMGGWLRVASEPPRVFSVSARLPAKGAAS
ncbi:MAG TPA: histidine kinase [Polyangiaceae bacterium]|jgi:signal transduction histidine kinase